MVLKEDSSQTCGITESLTSTKEKMLNTRRFKYGRDMVEEIRNGEFNISMKLRKPKPRDS